MHKDDKQPQAEGIIYRAKTQETRTDIFFLINNDEEGNQDLVIQIRERTLVRIRHIINRGLEEVDLIYHLAVYDGDHEIFTYPSNVADCFIRADKGPIRGPSPRPRQPSGPVQSTFINLQSFPDEDIASHGASASFELVMKHGDKPHFLLWIRSRPEMARIIGKDLDRIPVMEFLTQVRYEKAETILQAFEEVSEELTNHMLTTAEQLLEQGKEAGIQETKQNIAKCMLQELNMDIDLVQRATGLLKEDLKPLQ
ncbi:MAG: Rpn family recombination-promoting nuclease/putative transposase [Bacteroidota bacterium]